MPGRTSVDISNDTLERLSKLPHVAGIKDATADMTRCSLQRLTCGPDWVMLSGDDPSALGYIAHGGHGCISVTANVAPNLCARFQQACLAGDFAHALKLQDQLAPLHCALFLEPNPAGPKFALHLLGRSSSEVRLPLVRVSPPVEREIESAMRYAGLLGKTPQVEGSV